MHWSLPLDTIPLSPSPHAPASPVAGQLLPSVGELLPPPSHSKGERGLWKARSGKRRGREGREKPSDSEGDNSLSLEPFVGSAAIFLPNLCLLELILGVNHPGRQKKTTVVASEKVTESKRCNFATEKRYTYIEYLPNLLRFLAFSIIHDININFKHAY